MKISYLFAVGLALTGVVAHAQDAKTPPSLTDVRDWSSTLRQDAQALHDIILDSHPGAVDPLNPAFRARVETGLIEANRRADATTDAGGWWWAMRAYVAGFDDGHVQISMQAPGGLPIRWPGFLTVYKGGQQVVANRDAADAGTPLLGARLVDCDGVSADQLAKTRIGDFRGRWFLEAQHDQFGDWMFMSASNPWQSEMRQCDFAINGGVRRYALRWRSVDAADLEARRTQLMQRARGSIAMKRLDNGAYWLTLPSFDGSPDGQAYADLTAVTAQAAAQAQDLHAAPYVVLDVRGNGGGSSFWGVKLAMTLWGEDWLRAHWDQPAEVVDWRPSQANIAAITALRDQMRGAGGDENVIAWADRAIQGMTAARAAGQDYWREGDMDPGDSQPISTPENPNTGVIYVLTDSACASACLDAVDLWKAAGAVQVGRETSADTVYMEVRNATLPSGLAVIGVPMKVYRGRARGNNEPQRPSHRYDGDMADDGALASWIAGLNARS